MDERHEIMKECAAEAARIARGVRPEQLSQPSNCADFDVRTLVNHWVLYTSFGLEHRALRTPLPQELTERDFTADPDWQRTYTAQLERAVQAWEKPEAWEGEVDLGEAKMPAAEIASMVIKEMAVHGWDVATSTGQQIHLSERAAAFVHDVVANYAELYRQYDGFADPVEIPADSPTFAKALALSGRTP
ncbi:TIGR03086 family metal-binding protein [Actinocorallia lasiicapitis]